MERFTEKLSDGRNVLKKHYSYNESIMFGRFVDGKAVDRLADYEDLEESGNLYIKAYQIDEYPDDEMDAPYVVTVMIKMEMYDKNVHFLTREEAEAALEKIKGE